MAFLFWYGIRDRTRTHSMQRGRALPPRGSDASAANGGRSELSEWPRSVCNAGAQTPRRTPGTATGIPRRTLIKSSPISSTPCNNHHMKSSYYPKTFPDGSCFFIFLYCVDTVSSHPSTPPNNPCWYLVLGRSAYTVQRCSTVFRFLF